MAERDPDTIKKDIDQARDRLASTVDILAQRANPHLLADRVKARAVAFAKKPVVIAAVAGLGALGVVLVVRKIKNR
ncbi:MAG TPA: DUF3618 domain-containing protein [Mycobacterium sp.]|nr:DUF3618 domain-containing protein [Mycobacterium sp.]